MKKSARYALFMIFLITAAASTFAAEVSIQVVQDPAKQPPALAGYIQKGDYLIWAGRYTAAIAVAPRKQWSTINYGHPDVSGYILAFIPEGASKRTEVQIGVPSVRIDGKAVKPGQASVKQVGSAILVTTPFENAQGVKLEVRTQYSFAFESGRINVVSEIRNAGTAAVEKLSFSLWASALQSFNFSPFNEKAFPKLNFRVWPRPDHALGWHNQNPVDKAENPLPGKLGPGQVHRVSYCLFAGSDSSKVLDKLYAAAAIKPERLALEFKNFEGLTEIAVREAATGAVFFRSFMDKPAPLSLPLPRGTYDVRANFFPASVEKTITVDGGPALKPLVLEPPVFGKVKVSIADRKGRPALGKVSFIGLAPTPSPCFKPENPVETGRGWESFKNSVFPLREEKDVLLPAGAYLVTASRGPEYARETRIIEVVNGENPAMSFQLDKVVDTRGLVALDSHMHTQISDGGMLIPERLRSVVGEGIDVAVAADHNYVVDYRPDLERLGLDSDLAVISGTEVTAKTGSIHYNTFPNAIRPGELRNGVIDISNETPATLFALSRAKNPGTLIHLNHPRYPGLGYFLTYSLDPEAGASAEAPFSMDFDVMEAMNGVRLDEGNRKSIENWFHFLNRGYPVRIVGASDAHGIDGGEPGYARTYVLYDGPKGKDLDAPALVRAVKEGRSFVSTGPIVSVQVNRRGILGDLIPVKGGGSFGDLVKAKGGRVKVDIRVTGAPWLDVSEVRLVVNGKRQDPLPLELEAVGTLKFKGRALLELEKDAWIAVEVKGRPSLYPVIQQRTGATEAEGVVVPYALTNPIFVDADGNGACDPVWPEKLVIR